MRSIDEFLAHRFVTEHLPGVQLCPGPCQRNVSGWRRRAGAFAARICGAKARISGTALLGPQAIRDELRAFPMRIWILSADWRSYPRLSPDGVGKFLIDHFGRNPIEVDRINRRHRGVYGPTRESLQPRHSRGSCKTPLRSYLRLALLSAGIVVDGFGAAVPDG